MMKKIAFFAGLVLFVGGLMSTRFFNREEVEIKSWSAETPVSEVLRELGDEVPDHMTTNQGETMVKRGRELLHQGYTTGPDGKQTRIQSRHFVCTNCHNMRQEDPDLRFSDPDKRLDFVTENGLLLLQGTTLHGTVNRETWYNEDYEKKYGALVEPARHSLRNALHLCATVCSQGRDFEEWEMDAVLAYLWSIELKLGDLNLSEENWEQLKAVQEKGGKNPEAVAGIKTFFRSGSPATFLESPENKDEGYEVEATASADRGKMVYDASCLHCHSRQGPSNYLKLDHSNLSLSLLRRHVGRDGHLSIYEIIRHGTYADHGHRAYMPHFTAERMSNQQVEDLRAYVETSE